MPFQSQRQQIADLLTHVQELEEEKKKLESEKDHIEAEKNGLKAEKTGLEELLVKTKAEQRCLRKTLAMFVVLLGFALLAGAALFELHSQLSTGTQLLTTDLVSMTDANANLTLAVNMCVTEAEKTAANVTTVATDVIQLLSNEAMVNNSSMQKAGALLALDHMHEQLALEPRQQTSPTPFNARALFSTLTDPEERTAFVNGTLHATYEGLACDWLTKLYGTIHFQELRTEEEKVEMCSLKRECALLHYYINNVETLVTPPHYDNMTAVLEASFAFLLSGSVRNHKGAMDRVLTLVTEGNLTADEPLIVVAKAMTKAMMNAVTRPLTDRLDDLTSAIDKGVSMFDTLVVTPALRGVSQALTEAKHLSAVTVHVGDFVNRSVATLHSEALEAYHSLLRLLHKLLMVTAAAALGIVVAVAVVATCLHKH